MDTGTNYTNTYTKPGVFRVLLIDPNRLGPLKPRCNAFFFLLCYNVFPKKDIFLIFCIIQHVYRICDITVAYAHRERTVGALWAFCVEKKGRKNGIFEDRTAAFYRRFSVFTVWARRVALSVLPFFLQFLPFIRFKKKFPRSAPWAHCGREKFSFRWIYSELTVFLIFSV